MNFADLLAKGDEEVESSSFSWNICADRKAWLAERKKYIGASDAAAVIGVSPWMTNAQLWDDKTNPAVDESAPNEMMVRGIKSEGHIRELYSIESGDSVVDGAGVVLVSRRYPWMSATLDGVCLDSSGSNYSLEIKSCYYSSKWKGDLVPDNYVAQIVHQLAVTGWYKAVLRARIIYPDGDVSERGVTYLRDEWTDAIERLAEAERRFMESVKSGARPDEKMPDL